MIKQISSLIFLLTWFIYVSYICLLPAVIFKKDSIISPIIKDVFSSLISSGLKYGFQPKMYYTNKIEQSNKVDIIIANHISTIDTNIILTFLNYCGITNYILVGKKELMYLPGFGFHFMTDNHIKLSRNWDKDEHSLHQQIEKINNGVIIIFPEGTRFEPDKLKTGQKFSLENDLPVYNNLLVPKSKGLWTIFNELKKRNKMGKLYDMTIVMQNFIGKTAYLTDLVLKDTGNIFIINREIQPINYSEHSDFKNYLLKEWKKKDELINIYDKIVYEKMEIPDNKLYIFYSILFIISITYGLKKPENRFYFIGTILLSYMMTFSKKF